MLRGYARVSTKRQELALQLDALSAAGCEVIYTDKATGKNVERPNFQRLMAEVAAGDVVVVWKMSRFGRSTIDVINNVYALGKRDIGFRCTNEVEIDTTKPLGRFIFTVFAAMSELDNDMRREAIMAGLATSTKKPGPNTLGRGFQMTPDRIEGARRMLKANTPAAQVARSLGIGRTTLYRHMAEIETEPTQSKRRRKPRLIA